MAVFWGLLALALAGLWLKRSRDRARLARERRERAVRRIHDRVVVPEAIILLSFRRNGHLFLRVRELGEPYQHYVFITRSLVRDADTLRIGAIVSLRGRTRENRAGSRYLYPRRPDDVRLIRPVDPAALPCLPLESLDASCLNTVFRTRGRVEEILDVPGALYFRLNGADGASIVCHWLREPGDVEREAFKAAFARGVRDFEVLASAEMGREDYELTVGQVALLP